MTPRPMWATVEWGGKRIETASNIVFSNGLFDPWWVPSPAYTASQGIAFLFSLKSRQGAVYLSYKLA